jgi:hypothetical protein
LLPWRTVSGVRLMILKECGGRALDQNPIPALDNE